MSRKRGTASRPHGLDQGYADATDRLEAADYDREEAAIAVDWQRPVNERKRRISTNIDD